MEKVVFGGKGNNGIYVTDYFGGEIKQLTYYVAGWNINGLELRQLLLINFWAKISKPKKCGNVFDLQGKAKTFQHSLSWNGSGGEEIQFGGKGYF
jgi:hypothetical protein